jgi:hypothetical protein
VLVRACRKYRATLPTYLQSTKTELGLLDGMVQRLTAICEENEPDDL